MTRWSLDSRATLGADGMPTLVSTAALRRRADVLAARANERRGRGKLRFTRGKCARARVYRCAHAHSNILAG